MSGYPEPIERVVEELKKLPSVGQRTAERLMFHLLTQPKEEVTPLAKALLDLKDKIRLCARCFNFAEDELCPICRDDRRDQSVVCVVSHPQELWKIEKTSSYRGLYHVLGGLISPVNDVNPEDLHIEELIQRLQSGDVNEVILALDPNVEGEATGMYLARRVKPMGIEASRIAQGVPIGRDLEFADELTLTRALEGRIHI